MNKATELLEIAKKQPETTDGFIRSVFYGYLSLVVTQIQDKKQKVKKID